MASAIDPSVIADGANVAKSALRTQLSIARDEISALQSAGPGEAGTIWVDNAPPASPALGRLWIDTNTPNTTEWTLSAYSGSVWVPLARINLTSNRMTLIDGGSYNFATLLLNRQGGSKGGVLNVQTPSTGTTLLGDNVTMEIDGDQLLIYEAGGSKRGVRLTISEGANNGASGIWHNNSHGYIEGTVANTTTTVDLNSASWHTFGDIVLPDRASVVQVNGRANSLMAAAAGGQTVARVRLRLLNSDGNEITTANAGAWFAVPSQYEFYPIVGRIANLPDQTGMRLQLQMKKDDALGPLDVFEVFAMYTGVRRR